MDAKTWKATGTIQPIQFVGTQPECADYLGVIGGKEVFIETADGERIIVGIVSHTNLERLV